MVNFTIHLPLVWHFCKNNPSLGSPSKSGFKFFLLFICFNFTSLCDWLIRTIDWGEMSLWGWGKYYTSIDRTTCGREKTDPETQVSSTVVFCLLVESIARKKRTWYCRQKMFVSCKVHGHFWCWDMSQGGMILDHNVGSKFPFPETPNNSL